MRNAVTLCIAALAAALCLPALAAPSVKLGGYVQFRYVDLLGGADATTVDGVTKKVLGAGVSSESGSFNVRRARLSAKATLDENTAAVIEIDASKSAVETKKAYVSYTWKDITFAGGRNNIPFSYEIPLSSSSLTTLDRSMIANTMPEYITGLIITPGSRYLPLRTSLAFANGKESASYVDEDTNKVAIAKVEAPVGAHLVGASYMTDTHGHTAANGYGQLNLGRVSVTGEYLASEFASDLSPLATLENRGWYLLGAYAASGTTTLYARYDTLDNSAIDEKTRITVGSAIQLGENTEFTVEYQSIDDPANPDLHGLAAVQLQAKF